MRAFISKVAAASLIAAAAISLSACGKTETTTENTVVTDMNASDTMDTMSDNMTAVDTTSNDAGMMSNDSAPNAM